MEKIKSSKETIQQEHQREWHEKLEMLKAQDVYGYVINPGIVETVAILQLMGINTTQSDEGKFSNSPWVQFEADEPEDVYVGEKEVKERLMEQTGILPSEINQHSPDFSREKEVQIKETARIELMNSHAQYSGEFLQWQKETKDLVGKLQSSIDEFYEVEQIPEGYEDLKVSIQYPYQTPNHNEYIKDIPFLEVTIAGQRKNAQSHNETIVTRTKKEMTRFMEFLKNKYLNN
jgi:hypothetical protein